MPQRLAIDISTLSTDKYASHCWPDTPHISWHSWLRCQPCIFR
jgi:poly-D-alanine transfer protein DltD